MKKVPLFVSMVASVCLLSACSLLGSTDAKAPSASNSSNSSSQQPSNSNPANSGSNPSSDPSSTDSAQNSKQGDHKKDKDSNVDTNVDKTTLTNLYNEAKQGKVAGCEFPVGTKLQEIIDKWGEPNGGDPGTAVYTKKKCSFDTDFSDTNTEMSNLKVVAVHGNQAKFKKIKIDHVKKELGKPMSQKGKVMIYQAEAFKLKFYYDSNNRVTNVVVSK
ncbi:protein of unknown function [Thermoflavimicrobium dichotomicum]|uniref:DUF4309 domain-containing protein n=1 Tax=Thermoflavimicrobium dichotomicum TaxID=46223 RepID=A0A1I3R159_9BACL|nr:protein of unknown function [Thermoflavimicrobium dichotomicum]